MPVMTPVSCTGKNPLGTMMYSQIVPTRVATVTSKVALTTDVIVEPGNLTVTVVYKLKP